MKTTKETDIEKKTIKQHIKSVGIFYLFLSCVGATIYMLLVKVPNAPEWVNYPILLGTTISAVVAWYYRG
jgi:uncharacterized membrane protein